MQPRPLPVGTGGGSGSHPREAPSRPFIVGSMFITPAYAQAAGAAPDSSGSIFFMLQIGLVFAAFYFLIIRPQQKRAKTLQQSVEAVKKGDSVVTAGGIVGRVTKVEDRFVEVEIAPNTRVRVVKSTLTEVSNPLAKPAND